MSCNRFRANLNIYFQIKNRYKKDSQSFLHFVSMNPKVRSNRSSMHGQDQLSRDSGLEQQILLVSCLFFSRRGGYGSESICYRYMMRKN